MRLNYKMPEMPVFKILVIVGILFMGLSAKAGSFDSLRVESKGADTFVIHQVDKGETLYSLSKRYGVDIDQIISANEMVDNQLSLSQELIIPVSRDKVDLEAEDIVEEKEDEISRFHEVQPGDTFYAISKKYEVGVDEIRSANDFTTNELSVGQRLVIPGSARVSDELGTVIVSNEEEASLEDTSKTIKNQLPEGFSEYLVQTGESLGSIAGRFSVRPDSIVFWNNLPNSYLTIGQRLIIKGKLDQAKLLVKEEVETLHYGTRKEIKDNSGFTKILEEGTARKIETSTKTNKYLALHRTLSVGSLVEVRNLMNNQKIFVRVVGKLPETGLNKNVMIRLSPICFERLGVIDPKTRVEVSYFLD